MRVFVTGATGVIGRRVVPLLVSRRHAVTAVGRSAEKRAARAGATAVEVDLFAPDAVRAAVAGHDAILNLATHIPPSTGRMLMPGALDVRPPRFLPPWAARRMGSMGELLARSLRISNRKLREASNWAPTYPSVREGWLAVVSMRGAM